MTTLRKYCCRLVVASFLAVLFGIGFSVLSSQQYTAHADSVYDGQDPTSTVGGKVCANDARTAMTNPNGTSIGEDHLGTAYLQYSPSCGTNWARVTPNYSFNDLTAIIQTTDGRTQVSYGHNVGQISSPMLYSPAPDSAWAVGVVGPFVETPRG